MKGSLTGPALAGSSRDQAIAFNFLSVPDIYYENPYPWFELLREHDPVHANSDGSVFLSRYADVKQVWRDLTGLVDKSVAFRAKFGDGPLYEHHTTGMLFRDPPDHDRLRAIVNPFFSQASIAALRPFIEETVERLLHDVAARGDINFVSDFAFRLPIAVICRILGLPLADGDTIQELGRQVLFPLNPNATADDIARGNKAVAAFKTYLRKHVDAARRNHDLDGSANIISALVCAERAGTEVSENEVLHMCILVLNGGHETTTNLIAQSLNALLDRPDAMAEIQASAEISAAAIEELIRFVTPLQVQGRRTTRRIVLESGNGEIAPDTEIVLCQASANRDDRVFKEPNHLDLQRRPNLHVGFGAGVHVCIGRPLARLETSIAVPRFLRRFTSIERSGRVVFNRNVRFRGIQQLLLRVA